MVVNKKEVKRKLTKNSTSKKLPATNVEWDEYLNTISLQMFPSNNQFRERLAIELLEWARTNPEALIMEEFFDIKGITDKDLYRWMDKCEKLQVAYDVAKRIIGTRREKGAIKGEYNAGTIHFVMPHYSKIWEKTEEWRAGLRKDNEAQGNIKVMIESYPQSSIVPDKKKAE